MFKRGKPKRPFPVSGEWRSLFLPVPKFTEKRENALIPGLSRIPGKHLAVFLKNIPV
jgi:hypothetical protein